MWNRKRVFSYSALEGSPIKLMPPLVTRRNEEEIKGEYTAYFIYLDNIFLLGTVQNFYRYLKEKMYFYLFDYNHNVFAISK